MTARTFQFKSSAPGLRMNDPANWDALGGPPGAPGPGDTAYIRYATVEVDGEGAGVNVLLNNGTLNMTGGSIGAIEVTAAQYSAYTKGFGTFNVTGHVDETGGISVGGANRAPDTLTMTEAANAAFDNLGAISVLNGSSLLETGGTQSVFRNDGQINVGGSAILSIGSNFIGPGTVQDTATAADQGGQIEFGGSVTSDVNISLIGNADAAASLTIDNARDFKGNVAFNDGLIDLGGSLSDVRVWSLSNGVLRLGAQGGDAVSFNFVDQSPTAGKTTNLEVAKLGNDYYVTEGTLHQPAGAVLLQGGVVNVPPVTPPAAPQNVAVHDNTTGADVPDTSTPYTGPVAGIASQFISITPDNLNISAMADSLFIKTGAGNDAVALHSGTNVVDAGGGSNFLTSGSGFDTFFLDCRAIPPASSAAGLVPGAIWDTVQNFGHSDAVTLFGVGPGTALNWQKNEGAVGHTGLTLHANLPNGSEASLTLAGIDSKVGLQLSYGTVAGSSYLYVRSA